MIICPSPSTPTFLTNTNNRRRSLTLTAGHPIITREHVDPTSNDRTIVWSKQYGDYAMTQYAFEITNDENTLYTMTSDSSTSNTYLYVINTIDGDVSRVFQHTYTITTPLSSMAISANDTVYYTVTSKLSTLPKPQNHLLYQ